MLIVTILSVGNGDSVLLEYQASQNNSHFALIDCNDSTNLKSTHIYLKRYFETRGIQRTAGSNIFDFVMLSHAHADHISGLQDVIRTYGTDTVYLSRTINIGGHAPFRAYIQRSINVRKVVSLDDSHPNIQFGKSIIKVIWPLSTSVVSSNENNNSIVFDLSYANHHFVFTGDAEYVVWNDQSVVNSLQALGRIDVFKVPHHGAENGTIDPANGNGTWPNSIQSLNFAVISSHVKPYNHPDQAVLNSLSSFGHLNTVLTDEQNIEFRITKNTGLSIKHFQ